MGGPIIFKRHVIIGTCLTCLLQTGVSAYGIQKSYAKEAADQIIDIRLPIKEGESAQDVAQAMANIAPAAGEASEPVLGEGPVDLLAERVEYDEIAGIVSAIGDVEMVQAGRILRADRVSYNLGKDQVTATGNVILNEITGDTYFAENVELKDKMKDGFVRGLSGVLADGSRFTAEEAEKIADLKIIMRKGTYTPCEPCKNNPDATPLWEIKAREVTHHKDEQRISYEDATLEVKGTPIGYLPYFSHADGTVRRKSGFLTPSVGYDSELGGIYQQDYYWDIAPDKDATIGTAVFTGEAPMLLGEYRQRFKDAEIQFAGGATYSSRIDDISGNSVITDNEKRGHLFVDGLWNIDEKWRAGTELRLVSDEQYLNQYNISSEDVLHNKAYVERFDDRDYTTARIIRFKDVRVSDRQVADQPNVLPEVYSKFIGDPNALFGGRWSLEASALGLQRAGNEQDIARGILEAGWQRRMVSNFGLVNTLDLTTRGDFYEVNDSNSLALSPGEDTNYSDARGFAQAHYQTSFPLNRDFENTQMVVEPLAALTIGTNLDDDTKIPNEDSQDVFLDVTNIFNANRFPGQDRIEDRSRGTYGVRTGLYADNGYQGEVFLGQSYRFNNDDNPFAEGSGLSKQESDVVGNVSVKLGPKLNLNYGMQLANDTLASRRHEVDATGKIGRFTLGTRYFYSNSLQGTDLDESREQIRNSVRYHINDDWSVFGATQYDLATETEGLRRMSYGLDYEGQCVTFFIRGKRELTKDSSGDSGTEIMMRLGLKNLGEFETSGFTLGGSSSNDNLDDEQ